MIFIKFRDAPMHGPGKYPEMEIQDIKPTVPPLYPAKIEIKLTTHGAKYIPSTIQGRISLMSTSSAEIAIESPRMSQHWFRAQLAAK